MPVRFDALIAGPRTFVEKENLADENKDDPPEQFKRFFTRSPILQATEAFEKIRDAFRNGGQKIFYTFGSGYIDRRSFKVTEFLYGETIPSYLSMMDETICHISFEVVEPLLNSEITVAERMVNSFLLAETIVHETIVCRFYPISGAIDKVDGFEACTIRRGNEH
jgi:hypothetical protein